MQTEPVWRWGGSDSERNWCGWKRGNWLWRIPLDNEVRPTQVCRTASAHNQGQKIHLTSLHFCAVREMQLVDDRERRLRTALETIESDGRKIRKNHLIRLLMVMISIFTEFTHLPFSKWLKLQCTIYKSVDLISLQRVDVRVSVKTTK